MDVTMDVDISFAEAPSLELGEFRVSFGPTSRTLIAAQQVTKTARRDATVFSFKLVDRWYPVSN